MKRLFILTIILFALAGVTFWYLGQGPSGQTVNQSQVNQQKAAVVAALVPKAEAGNSAAQFELGKAYETGVGVPKNIQKAFAWYKKSADKGSSQARFTLGMMYANGKGAVRQDYFQAAKWFRVAATFNNDAASQFRLGELYFYGRGVEHDYGKAIEYYTQAANQGHAGGQYLLGAMYFEGWGVEKDYIQAYVWLKQAVPHQAQALAIHRKYDPVTRFKSLQIKMNKFQISEAEKKLKALKKRR
ncbi:MAG: sel1 repeat family protein [Magnetovibrio sp.]|nr:sel1 repeat family protein [Magnetovibrio sp.]